LVVAAPVLAAIAVAVRITMGAPVLFRQERAGKDGVPFTLVKFRTMTVRSGDSFDPSDDGIRLTPLGRRLRALSLDELPQLWNVVRGDMALVGPRPLPMVYVDRYDDRQRRRLEVRPGITGLAQVSGRNAISWDEKFDLDVDYVDRRSARLDLQILWRTLAAVVRRDGIAADGQDTMTEFLGSARAA
jgi:lipopolysaccharide/colanic/teichoic acid biosynthesis glycosyltransferase